MQNVWTEERLCAELQVRNCLLEERSGERSFSWTPVGRPPLTMKWTLHNVSIAVPPLQMGLL